MKRSENLNLLNELDNLMFYMQLKKLGNTIWKQDEWRKINLRL